MHQSQQDYPIHQLISAIEDNLSAWVPALGTLGEVKKNDPPGVSRAACDIPLALFNSIMETHLSDDRVDEAIKTIIADVKQRKVPILWWTGPSTQPANLGEILERNGFEIDDDGPGMAVILDDLNEELPVPGDVSIHAVDNEAELLTWCQTLPVGFGASEEQVSFVAPAWYKLMSRLDPEIVTAYLAFLHGEPVATSLLFMGAGVAGIYGVGTIPSARRKGIGARLTLQPLLDARKHGLKVGILQASEMGYGIYQSIGFKEYCRIRSYVYHP